MRWALVVVGYAVFFVAFFWPVLGSGQFLAFGDGRSQWLPMYFGPWRLWEPNLMLGYPQFANPEQFWYPLTALRTVAGSFNAYVIAAYVLAACGAYGLVRAETRSTLGAILGGLAYALGGFMIAHLQHLDIIHPAAWAPFFFWAVRSLRRRFSLIWLSAGAAAFACCVLGGQPQISVYAAILGVVLCASRAVAALVCIGLGAALAGIALLPGAELAAHSVRATMPFYQFAPGVPVTHVPIRLLFPYLLGGSTMALYPHSAFALDPFVEQSDYVGILTLILAVAAVRSSFAAGTVRLWAAVAGVALLLSTGNDLGLATLTSHVPVLNLFRSQGRHAFELGLAAAVLMGFAVAGIENGAIRLVQLAQAATAVAAAMACTLALTAASAHFSLERFVPQLADLRDLLVAPAANPAAGVPLLVFATGSAALFFFGRHPHDAVARASLVAALALDLTSFAWFAYWHWAPLSAAALEPPRYAQALRSGLTLGRQREFTLELPGAVTSLRPNANVLWDIPSAWASFALLPGRSAALLHSVRSDFFGPLTAAAMEDGADRSFDLAAVRYFIIPGGAPGSRPIDRPWDESYDWDRRIGSAPLAPATLFELRSAKAATDVALVTSLGLAAAIGDDVAVADVVVHDVHGRRFAAPLRAGRETAEIAYDRFDVRPYVKHARPALYSSDGPSHRYAATIEFPARMAVDRIEIRWRNGPAHDASLLVDKVSLLDRSAHSAQPVSPLFLLNDDPARFRVVALPGADTILENERAFGRVWTVGRVVSADPQTALDAVRRGSVDFHATALVEGGPPLSDGSAGTARITAFGPERMRVGVACKAACFLVTSDAVYPGWHAYVDGQPTPLYNADYALRGTFVPAGSHAVEFRFASQTLAIGASVTLAALATLGTILALAYFSAARRPTKNPPSDVLGE